MYRLPDRNRPVVYVRLVLGPTLRAVGRAIYWLILGFVLGIAVHRLVVVLPVSY